MIWVHYFFKNNYHLLISYLETFLSLN